MSHRTNWIFGNALSSCWTISGIARLCALLYFLGPIVHSSAVKKNRVWNRWALVRSFDKEALFTAARLPMDVRHPLGYQLLAPPIYCWTCKCTFEFFQRRRVERYLQGGMTLNYSSFNIRKLEPIAWRAMFVVGVWEVLNTFETYTIDGFRIIQVHIKSINSSVSYFADCNVGFCLLINHIISWIGRLWEYWVNIGHQLCSQSRARSLRADLSANCI